MTRRLRDLDVTAVEADVLKPLPVEGPFASAGLAQRRHDGYLEAPIFTGGDDLGAVRRLSPEGDGYSATAALALIRGQ